jgi:hypothetical protein
MLYPLVRVADVGRLLRGWIFNDPSQLPSAAFAQWISNFFAILLKHIFSMVSVTSNPRQRI